ERVGTRLYDTARFFVEFGRVEANHAGKRLAVGENAVGLLQRVCVPRGDVDVIAEHGVVTNLERRDPRGIAIAAFERGDGAAAVGCGIAQSIELRIASFGDITALRRV